eukprot:TRINITY_DN65_c1_g1_i1.p1 TRINITY_DN65_c1_g1~~TRINITY_DN65_c1_g1_i1.p1  ORF type:complete len:711 (+),score=294.08 TRINITY_DN65_c1_g1_i1:247-2379(+)
MSKMSKSALVAATLCLTGSEAFKLDSARTNHQEALTVSANPIRKVVTMMQKMGKKLEEEAEAEAELYEKFECYCKKTKTSLSEAIDKAVSVGPITPEDIEAKKNEMAAIENEVAKLKGEKIDDENSLKAAKVNREKEHDIYLHITFEEEETEHAAEGALEALGVSTTEAPPAFLQTDSKSGFGAGVGAKWFPSLMKAFDHSKKVAPDQKEKVIGFLQGKGEASPGDSADVAVYIEDVEHEAEDNIQKENKEEDGEVVDYSHVKKSKKDEISALLNQMERKMKAIGQLKVDVVNMEHDMADGAETLEENKKMLAEVTKNCEDKAKDFEERKKYRADEQLAIADAIKMLNSDDALELFKKTIKNPALVQLEAGHRQALQKVKSMVDALRAKNTENRPALNFLALALSGKKVDFTSVFKKVDEMIALMKKEQGDDNSKKDYCNAEFESSADKIKGINKKITELSSDLTAGKQGMEKLDEEMAALQAGVKDLDASMTEATANRQAEHAEYGELMQGNSAAVKLIGLAKNRLQEFYNPSLAADTATTTVNPLDPYAFVQESSHRGDPVEVGTPPPTFGGDYKSKGEESNGVMKMMDTLVNDLEKEMTIAKVEEQNAQKDYEETVADAKKKRETDLKSAASKAQSKADLQAEYQSDKEDNKAKNTELMEAKKYVSDLHAECDWLLQNFDVRKQARIEETESMTRAKAVLAGADFDF